MHRPGGPHAVELGKEFKMVRILNLLSRIGGMLEMSFAGITGSGPLGCFLAPAATWSHYLGKLLKTNIGKFSHKNLPL